MTAKTPPSRLDTGTSGSSNIMVGGTGPSIARQIRARRDGADRCPPLRCGHRDPFDCWGRCERFPASRAGILCAREHLAALGLASEHTDDVLRRLWHGATGDPEERFAHELRAEVAR